MNVSGDLVACAVMDRYVTAGPSREQELRTQDQHDARGEHSGEDVITT